MFIFDPEMEQIQQDQILEAIESIMQIVDDVAQQARSDPASSFSRAIDPE